MTEILNLKFLEMMKAEVRERYHRGVDADPNLRAAYEEDLGQEAVMAYTEVIALIWAHIQAYVDEVVEKRADPRVIVDLLRRRFPSNGGAM